MDSFIATLEETINEEARQRKSSQGLPEPLPEFLEDLKVKVKQNIKIQKVPTSVGDAPFYYYYFYMFNL